MKRSNKSNQILHRNQKSRYSLQRLKEFKRIRRKKLKRLRNLTEVDQEAEIEMRHLRREI